MTRVPTTIRPRPVEAKPAQPWRLVLGGAAVIGVLLVGRHLVTQRDPVESDAASQAARSAGGPPAVGDTLASNNRQAEAVLANRAMPRHEFEPLLPLPKGSTG